MATRRRFKKHFVIPTEEPPPGANPAEQQDYLLEIARKHAGRIARIGRKGRRR